MTTNREKFLNEYNILHIASVGVTIVKTREPHRVMDALHEFAAINRYPFKSYSMLTGWATYNANDPNADPTYDNNKDWLSATAAIANLGASANTAVWPDGVYVQMWPHFPMPKQPSMMQMYLELSRICSQSKKRVILVVPPGFDVPSELADSVAVLDFDLPNREELLESYQRVCEGIRDQRKAPSYGQAEVDQILNAVVGMTEMEAESAIARAVAQFRNRFPNVPIDDFVSSVMTVKVEVIKRSNVLELMPVETMDSVGGLGLLKEWIGDRRTAFNKEARDAGVDRPKGILLVGPPGTGKSLAAKASAHALQLPLLRFDLSRVYGGIVGQTESAIRDTLKTLEAIAPCVALLDELDKSIPSGLDSNGGVSQRVLGTILTFMQESKAPIFWVCTANRTNNLPSELVRKGRLDEIFSIILPTEDEREATLRIHISKRMEDPDAITDLNLAVAASSGYVGAEIEAAVKEAKLTGFNAGTPMTGAMIAAQFAHGKPLSVAFAEDFERMQRWAESNARPASMSASALPPASDGSAPMPRPRRREIIAPTSMDG